MNARKQAIKALEDAGYVFDHHGGSHDVYKHITTGYVIPVARHNFRENTLRYILHEIRRGHR